MEGKTVVSIGCGCTRDLSAFPAAVKIAIDPLLYVYQKLGMLTDDSPVTGRSIFPWAPRISPCWTSRRSADMPERSRSYARPVDYDERTVEDPEKGRSAVRKRRYRRSADSG